MRVGEVIRKRGAVVIAAGGVLYDANRDRVKDPDVLKPGILSGIPPFSSREDNQR